MDSIENMWYLLFRAIHWINLSQTATKFFIAKNRNVSQEVIKRVIVSLRCVSKEKKRTDY